MKHLALIAPLLLVACAHPYTLDPLVEKPEYLNGVALATANETTCVLQAGYQYSNPLEMLVKIRFTNKGKAAIDVDHSGFTLVGPPETLKTSPLAAAEPEKYLKDLNATAELLESRMRMESYQGVEQLGELNGNSSDSAINSAKRAFSEKQDEAERSRKESAAIRERIAVIQPAVLRKNTVKPGESIEGALVFPAAFGETGVVTLTSSIPGCGAKLAFMLKK